MQQRYSGTRKILRFLFNILLVAFELIEETARNILSKTTTQHKRDGYIEFKKHQRWIFDGLYFIDR